MSDPRPSELVDHLFRHHYGRLVAGLTRVFGADRLDLVEDVVQEALLRALEIWPFQGVPKSPFAWLVRAANNAAIDVLRHRSMTERHRLDLQRWAERASSSDPQVASDEIEDDCLRMMFTCCHPSLPVKSQVALTLKTLGGLGVTEIAAALLQKEATVAQLLSRAKARLQREAVAFEVPGPLDRARRLDAVLDVLYLVFNEGYSAHVGEQLVRGELVAEALRLAHLLAHATGSAEPRVHALLALMHFLAARIPARTSARGQLFTLVEQDRGLWDRAHIGLGFEHFAASLVGDEMSAFHVEASIASLHAMAPRPEETNWTLVLQRYDQLVPLRDSPVVRLNRAIALSKVDGPLAGLACIERLVQEGELDHYHLAFAAQGHLLWILERRDRAVDALRRARSLAQVEPERNFLDQRIEACLRGEPPPTL